MKIYTTQELKEHSQRRGADVFDPLPEPERKLTWWVRLGNWLWPDRQKLLDENTKLQTELLKAKMACQDAGKHGLMLYAENEALRENAANVLVGDEVRARVEQRVRDLEKENHELTNKLKRAYDDHDRLHEDVKKWINQFQK